MSEGTDVQKQTSKTIGGPFRYLRGRSSGEIFKAFVSAVFAGGLVALLLAASANMLLERWISQDVSRYLWGVFSVPLVITSFLNYYKPSKTEFSSEEAERIIRRQEELYNRLMTAEKAGGSDRTRATLIVRAHDVRQDQERLWGRSRVSFFLGCVFLVLALGGPISAIWLVAKHQDWRFYLAGASLTAVMLASAAIVFRQESKLRAQYRLSSDEIAYFNRIQVALDCAWAVSDEVYRETLKQIISFLVARGPALSVASRSMEIERDEGGSGDPVSMVGKVVDASTELAKSTLTRIRKGE